MPMADNNRRLITSDYPEPGWFKLPANADPHAVELHDLHSFFGWLKKPKRKNKFTRRQSSSQRPIIVTRRCQDALYVSTNDLLTMNSLN